MTLGRRVPFGWKPLLLTPPTLGWQDQLERAD